MKKLWLLLPLLAGMAHAQATRYDGNVFTSATNVPYGAQAAMYTLPFAKISICAYPASGGPCTNYAPVYYDQALTQVVSPPITADAQGRYGFWTTGGLYTYSVVTAAGTYVGTYNLNIGGSSSSTTYIQGVSPISVTGTGTSGNPYVVSQAGAFTINSFTGCAGTVELGTSIVNPAFAATYSTTPTTATITNSQGINSPLALTTPFTSGTVTGTFTHSSVFTTTFTLNATGSSVQTASCSNTWQPAIFGGVGATGATSTVTSSGTNAILSTGDHIPRFQLGAETAGSSGTTFSVSPSAQVVYLLLTGGSHTFVDANTGFPFAFNAPTTVTFVNAQGATVTMYLYASTNALTGNFAPRVQS